MIRPTRSALRVLLVATMAAGGTLVYSTPALAEPDYPCTTANAGARELVIESADVNPTLTHFMAVNIAPGTTGERTESLSVVNEVTVSIGLSTEIGSEGSIVFGKVKVKVGFNVQYTTATTRTETTTTRWTFNEPGYYGLYKGTRAVSGTMKSFRCAIFREAGAWLPSGLHAFGTAYTTFDHVEIGTVRCGDSTPPGTLREQARLQLGC